MSLYDYSLYLQSGLAYLRFKLPFLFCIIIFVGWEFDSQYINKYIRPCQI